MRPSSVKKRGNSVVRVVVQDRLVVLPAVEHADDGNQIAGHIEGDHGALAVVGVASENGK